ncbi:MAG: Toxin RelG [Firmicutes bacterium ADurb.Bin099]|nr:MAG: Toxin RelG [Firmicutes bacterium ADurb.Bin099]
MNYQVIFTQAAMRELRKLDRYVASMITSWIRKNLEGCSNPRQHGKSLTAAHSGKWSYRIGCYRLLADIQDDKILILILNVGDRKEIYKKTSTVNETF